MHGHPIHTHRNVQPLQGADRLWRSFWRSIVSLKRGTVKTDRREQAIKAIFKKRKGEKRCEMKSSWRIKLNATREGWEDFTLFPLIGSVLRWPATNLCQCQQESFPKHTGISNASVSLTGVHKRVQWRVTSTVQCNSDKEKCHSIQQRCRNSSESWQMYVYVLCYSAVKDNTFTLSNRCTTNVKTLV